VVWSEGWFNKLRANGNITIKPDGIIHDFNAMICESSAAGVDCYPGTTSEGSIGHTGAVFSEGWFDKLTSDGDITLDPGGHNVNPGSDNTDDLGTASTGRWKNGYIANAWTVGDLVFNYEDVNYRIVEAEKLTNNKLKGLMYVMEGKAVMWIEPTGKLHTTQEIDTSWEGITGLSFDIDGGVYIDNEVVRYPVIGSGNETFLSPVFVDDGKKEYKGDKVGKVKTKPNKKPTTTSMTLVGQTTTTLNNPTSTTLMCNKGYAVNSTDGICYLIYE